MDDSMVVCGSWGCKVVKLPPVVDRHAEGQAVRAIQRAILYRRDPDKDPLVKRLLDQAYGNPHQLKLPDFRKE